MSFTFIPDNKTPQPQSAPKRTSMAWTEKHDHYLCREIIASDPFTETKKGTTQRSLKWSEVANALSKIKDISSPFRVDKRSVRDRYNLLAEKFRRKMKAEEKESGIDTELTEVEEALQLITEKEDASEEMHKEQSDIKKSKVQADKEGAEEMRQKAMERLSETRKRQVKEDDKTTPSKKRRTGGNDTMTFLKEKHETNVGLAKLDRELKEKHLEAEAKRHTETLTMFQQQQQQQMQFFQQMMAQQHQQQQQFQREQAEFMKNLFEKLMK